MPYKVVFTGGHEPSIEDKLNEMEEEGWDLQQAYSFSPSRGAQETPHKHALIFRRK